MLKTVVMLNIVETVTHIQTVFYIQERSAKSAYKKPRDKEYCHENSRKLFLILLSHWKEWSWIKIHGTEQFKI